MAVAVSLEKALSAPVFFVLFGLLFLFFGAQRLLKVSSAPDKRDALIWGSVGVFIAFGFFWTAAWFFRGDPAETDRQLNDVSSRRRLP